MYWRPRTPIKDAELISLLRTHLAPQLPGNDWLLLKGLTVVRVTGFLMTGLSFEKGSSSTDVTVYVFTRPLYWPASEYAVGLGGRIGEWIGRGDTWWEFGLVDRRDKSAAELSAAIIEHALPTLSLINDEDSVVRLVKSNLTGPVFSIHDIFLNAEQGYDLAFGYLCAWSGHNLMARFTLSRALRYMSKDRQAEQIEHLRTTLRLLDKPAEVREFLTRTGNEIRSRLKLDSPRAFRV
jgi:hypothetical protein